MDAMTFIFSHVCGQQRLFVIDGEAMPVCQRCFGLYAGAAAAGLWLVANCTWRRGLPDRRAAAVHAAMLLAAMLGGLHLLDPGPAWRLTCGLWTGYVAVVWLSGAAAELALGPRPCPERTWSRTIEAAAAAVILSGAAAAFDQYQPPLWHVWAACVVAGAAVLVSCLLAALLAAAIRTVRRVRNTDSPTPHRSMRSGQATVISRSASHAPCRLQ